MTIPTTFSDQFREVVTDIQSQGADALLRRSRHMDEAMAEHVMPCLHAATDAISEVSRVVGLLTGKDDCEVAHAVRNAALGGAFQLGLMVGLEFAKRGYALPADTSLDQV